MLLLFLLSLFCLFDCCCCCHWLLVVRFADVVDGVIVVVFRVTIALLLLFLHNSVTAVVLLLFLLLLVLLFVCFFFCFVLFIFLTRLCEVSLSSLQTMTMVRVVRDLCGTYITSLSLLQYLQKCAYLLVASARCVLCFVGLVAWVPLCVFLALSRC